MLRDAMTAKRGSGGGGKLCHVTRTFRLSAPCCVYLLFSLLVFLLLAHLARFSLVAMVTTKRRAFVGAEKRVPAVVEWDAGFAAELRDPPQEEKVRYDDPAPLLQDRTKEEEEETDPPVIHFTDNLPIRQHDVIEQQADRTLAAGITSASSSSSAKSAPPSQEEEDKKEEEKESVPSRDPEQQEAEKDALTAAQKSHDQMIRRFQAIQDTYRKDARFRDYYNGTVEELPVPKKAVYLQTNYRSGSTFLGQIFNQHPDVFYTFEPLFPFKESLGAMVERERAVIRANLRCEFIPALEQFRQLPPKVRKSNVVSECLINDMCFRYKTRGLCEEERCATRKARGACTACGPLNMKRLNNFCRRHKMVATKVIRLADLGVLQELMEEPGMDVKVVHLIRDPRGIASSRYKLNKVWSRIGIQGTCERLVANARLASEVAPAWLRDRYMMVRYEDLSRDPIGVTSRIYDFVGLELRPEMRAWIDANTRASATRSGPYTTRRDSAATAQAWRGELTYGQVSEVQEHEACARALRYFGYRRVDSPQQLANTTISLLDDL